MQPERCQIYFLLINKPDTIVYWHADDENSAAARTSLANRSAKFRFRGVSAHAAGAPEKARSALDGVEAFNFMVNLMREHVPQETRIHYVITAGGLAPNVVPDFAEVFHYLRYPESAKVTELWLRLEQAALGYGSTDVGDVSIAVPTVGVRIAGFVPSTSCHSRQAVAASGMSIGFKGAHNAAKTLALAGIEILSNEELRDAARREHEAKLGDRPPPLDYRE
ncbi:MAG: peptidase dimerization domain-containing protein [Woeseia sp.]|nr:peptidase dimerization domain-containing protein [Woeseia sp.]